MKALAPLPSYLKDSMRSLIALLALLASTTALAAQPAPIKMNCPAQPGSGRPATSFVWDGTSLSEVLVDRGPTIWKVASSAQTLAPGKTIDTRTMSFNRAQSPLEVAANKRTAIALQLSEFHTKGPILVLFQMAVLEDGYLIGAMSASFMGCERAAP